MIKRQETFFSNLKFIDWQLLLVSLFLTVTGLLFIYSSTLQTGNPWLFVGKQIFAFFIGILLMLIFIGIDYRFFREYFLQIYFVSIFLLILVLIFGKTIRGSKAWLDFGLFTFQPSEITKILFILSLGGFLDKNSKELYRWQKLTIPVLMLVGNVVLILLQPDFSSTLVYFPVFLVMLYCSGARVLHLSSFVFYGLVSMSIPLIKTLLAPYLKTTSFLIGILNYKIELLFFVLFVGLFLFLLWWFLKRWRINIPVFYFIFTYLLFIFGIFSSYFVGKSIKEHQRKRLVVFINPKVDALGSGYNIIQSKIAVGSGKIFGKGIFNGTQAQLGFLPAQHTDFIFSLISEETGFVFSMIMIILYVFLIWRIVNIAYESRDSYGSIVAAGLGTMFAFYSIVNIGMVVGLMPITGLPLPLVSYGGSSLISSLICLGILFSINIRRFMY